MLTNAKSRQGVIYPYFICAGRHSKRTNCEQQAMPNSDVETAIEDYYRRIQIPDHIVTALRELITRQFDRLQATSEQERQAHKIERDALRDERTKLLQAHYAGAVPLDLLASEQERIARRIAFLDVQIEAGTIEYEQAQAHLDDCLALAGDCHAIYMSIDDSLRRIANQAIFDKLIIAEEICIDGRPGPPFNVLFDPEAQATAVARQGQTVESGTQPGNVAGLNNDAWVDPTGLEPMTSTV
jgi:site-specific DNA recombinase